MAVQLTQESKFLRKYSVTGTGMLGDSVNRALIEAKLRVVVRDAGAGNVITVRARIQNDPNWTDLGTVTGATTDTFDISTWDELQFECTTFGGSDCIVYISGFITTFVDEPVEVTGSVTGQFSPSGLNVDLEITNTTVTDTAAKLPAMPLSDRNSMIILNTSASDSIFIGDSNVTASGGNEGWEIDAGSFFSLDIKDTIEIYAIAPTGKTVSVKIMELA